MKHKIVRGNAGLSGIEALAPGHPFRCSPDVSILINDTRALASELEYDRRQILGSRCHHQTSQRRASGKEYHIPTLFQQQSVHISMSLCHSYILFKESITDHIFDYFRDCGNIW